MDDRWIDWTGSIGQAPNFIQGSIGQAPNFIQGSIGQAPNFIKRLSFVSAAQTACTDLNSLFGLSSHELNERTLASDR